MINGEELEEMAELAFSIVSWVMFVLCLFVLGIWLGCLFQMVVGV
jgi:uncharacterized membrane protein YiaA